MLPSGPSMGSSNPLSIDASVLADLQAGNALALEECYRVFGARVYRVCRSMLSQESDAEDACQEVFIKLYSRASQFAGRSSFSTWLHRIAINHCLQRIEKEGRRRAKGIDEHLQDSGPSPLQRSSELESQERIDDLLARLPAHQRAVLVLREVQEFSYAEIASTLEIPEGTVMSRLARGRERLARLMLDPNKERDSRCAS